jgi:Uma2 family endonuclease
MTQAKIKFANFEAYLVWSDDPENHREGFFELIDGELVELAPISGLSATIANRIFFLLVAAGLVPLELVRPGKCEVQVPVLRLQDPANRYPDLVILQPEHVALTQRRLTITLDMAPPQLVAEVLSPGKRNRDRDLMRKRDQYAARGIPEYWLLDTEAQTVTVLQWREGIYGEVGMFREGDRIVSPRFPNLQLTAAQIF